MERSMTERHDAEQTLVEVLKGAIKRGDRKDPSGLAHWLVSNPVARQVLFKALDVVPRRWAEDHKHEIVSLRARAEQAERERDEERAGRERAQNDRDHFHAWMVKAQNERNEAVAKAEAEQDAAIDSRERAERMDHLATENERLRRWALEASQALHAATVIGQRSCRDGDHLNYTNHDRLIRELHEVALDANQIYEPGKYLIREAPPHGNEACWACHYGAEEPERWKDRHTCGGRRAVDRTGLSRAFGSRGTSTDVGIDSESPTKHDKLDDCDCRAAGYAEGDHGGGCRHRTS